MITIAWYNIVAILVGIIFIVWFAFDVNEEDNGHFGLGGCLPLLCCILFYIIWGGIFWW